MLLHTSKVLVLDDKILILFAICIFAWVLPRITKFKYGDLELELAEVKAEQARIVEALAEPPTGPESFKVATLIEGGTDGLGALTGVLASRKVLVALAEGPYPFRSQAALVRRTGLTADTLARELQALAEGGQVVQVRGKAGQPLWGITTSGRVAAT
ncbi:hypothetical protein [Gemmobacter aquatilis]|uniref:hypothetical protein n=1 Tax=Gemmobacter aquatilis TaxID=933059 RepID=UPI001113FF6D|nr:hypothetical protein [Gemmobacter aquatilis]